MWKFLYFVMAGLTYAKNQKQYIQIASLSYLFRYFFFPVEVSTYCPPLGPVKICSEDWAAFEGSGVAKGLGFGAIPVCCTV